MAGECGMRSAECGMRSHQDSAGAERGMRGGAVWVCEGKAARQRTQSKTLARWTSAGFFPRGFGVRPVLRRFAWLATRARRNPQARYFLSRMNLTRRWPKCGVRSAEWNADGNFREFSHPPTQHNKYFPLRSARNEVVRLTQIILRAIGFS